MRLLFLLLIALMIFASGYATDHLTLLGEFRPIPANASRIIHVLDLQKYGDRLYCCGWGGVSAFDLANPEKPVHLGNYNDLLQITGDYYYRMAVQDSVAYVTRRYGGIDIFNFANPQQPALAGKYRLDENSCYENVLLDGTTLFAASHGNGVEIIDVAQPLVPKHRDRIETPNAFALAKKGEFLYIADQIEGLVTVRIPESGTMEILSRAPMHGVAQFLDIDGNYLYAACGSYGVEIFHLLDQEKPEWISNYPGLAFSQHLDATNEKLYIAEYDVIELVDVSDPRHPRRLAKEDTKDQSMGVLACGDLVYVADWEDGRVYRYTPQASPDLYVQPAFLSFGSMNAGSVKSLQLPLINVGNKVLQINDIALQSDELYVTPKTMNIAPGDTATILLTFTPGTTMMLSDTLQILSDDPDQSIYKIPVLTSQKDFGIGDVAPDFTLSSLEDFQSYSLSSFRGKIIFLTFFCSW